MPDNFTSFFDTSGFMPHGMCYLWRPGVLWLNVGADLLIGLSYFAIPAILLYFMLSRRDLPFPRLFGLFALFILLCGSTHFFSIWTVWNPNYHFEGMIKLLTGLVSATTVLVLFRVAPQALALRSPTALEALIAERTDTLVETNRQLNQALAIQERTQAALRERVEEVQTLFDTLPIGILISHDAECRRITGNRLASELLRMSTAANLSKTASAEERPTHFSIYRSGREVPPYELPVQRAARGECVPSEEIRILFDDGAERHALVSATPLFGLHGEVRGAVGAILDITERKAAEAALFAEKERAQITLASIGDAVITTNAAGIVEYVNPVAEALTGWPLAEACGRTLQDVFVIVHEETRLPAPDPAARCMTDGRVIGLANHTLLIGRHGIEYAIEDSAAPIRDRDGRVLGIVLVFHDVTEQRRLAREISHQATHDALTGLVNRREFEHRLSRVIETAQTDFSEHALCYLDLDQFKVVNDTCGHVAGDELLRQLAELFRSRVRQRDTLARLGGDEFGLLLEHCTPKKAEQVAHTLRQAIAEFRFGWDDQSFHISVSIGLVPINAASGGLAAVLRAADSACYVAKDAGRNRIHLYTQNDTALTRHHGELQWVGRIQQALDEDRFQLFAQRITPLAAGATGGLHCELLLRLVDEGGRLVAPGAFLPAAERYHLTARVDRWVVDHAFRWLADHADALARLDLCTINLSGPSLSDRTFQNHVSSQLDAFALPATKIGFEITETAAIANLADATHFIKTLKTRGCRFALDDFGSGLSSFAYLKNLPIDFLKIDGLFVKDLIDDPIDLAMVRSINEIGQLLGKQTIAEYVENDAILERLRQIGVDYAQGFGIDRPCPLAALLTGQNAAG